MNQPPSLPQTITPFKIDWRFLVTLILAFIVVYGYAIFNYSITIDNEAELFSNHDKWYLSCHRWGLVLLRNTLFATTVTPYSSMITTMLALSLAALVMAASIRWQHTLQKYIFGILFLIFPQFAYHMQFTLQIDAVALGILSSALGYKSFCLYENTKRFRHALLSVFGITLGIACYQSILFIPPILFAAGQLNRLLQTDHKPPETTIGKTFLSFGLILGASVLAYYLCTYAALLLLHLPLSNEYLNGMIMWKQESWQTCFHQIAHILGRHLSGTAYIGELFYASIWIPAAILGKTLFSHTLHLSRARRIGGICLILAIILLPFTQIVIMADEQPARVFLAQSCALAILWALGYASMAEKLHLHRLLLPAAIGILAFATLKTSYLVSGWFHTDHTYNQAERLMANRIIDRIHEIGAPRGYTERKTPVVFLGNYDVKQTGEPLNPATFNTGDTFGCRFFNDECIGRRYTFIAISLISHLGIPTHADIEKARTFMADAPVWPHPDSIRYENGIMAVKLHKNME